MKQEQLLLEQVTLAEEILDKGAGDGRGIRLAALVLRLNEHMMQGKDPPFSWRPPAPATPDAFPQGTLEEMMEAIDSSWSDDTIYLEGEDVELIE